MSITLLNTKLYIPPSRLGLVQRLRLSDRLNAGTRLGNRLTLISAPAGFGKTTLVSEWVSRCGRPVAWITLDESDNDPLHFMAYFIAALQEIDPGFGQGLLDSIQSSKPPGFGSIFMALVNQVASITDPFILVLDDYHLIEENSVHNFVQFILEHMPPQMLLVVLTRVYPPLPVARLRGRGQLIELRREDLKFAPDEVAEFLNQVMDLGLTETEVSALAFRTEGWIAGLQMAALALQGQAPSGEDERTRKLIKSVTDSDRYVLDYLVEEVFQRQSDSVQKFLLYTSVLDRLCGSLCDTVVGIGGAIEDLEGGDLPSLHFPTSFGSGQEILEYMEQANLFLIPLDSQQEWYRYHRLFVDLLRRRLQRIYPDSPPLLHRRASAWFEENGFPTSAIEHALSAEDFTRAAYLIEEIAVGILSRGEMTTLLNWLNQLPDEVMQNRPILFLYHTWMLYINGHPIDEVEARLDDAVQSDSSDQIAGEVAMFRAALATVKGDIQRSIKLSETALELLPEDSYFFRGDTVRSLASAYELAGDLTAAIKTFDEAVKMDQRAGNVVGTIVGFTKLAGLRKVQGRLQEAYQLYHRALELGDDGHGNLQPIAGRAMTGLGELQREWNNLESAERYLEEGILLVKRWSNVWAIEGYVALAYVRQSKGDEQGARQAIQTAEELAVDFDASEMDDLEVSLNEVRLLLLQGNEESAMSWFEEHGLVEEISDIPVSYYLQEMEQTILARAYIAQGKREQAGKLLDSLQQEAEKLSRTGVLIEILILQALLLQSMNDTSAALNLLGRAISMAEPEGYVRLFLDEGKPMAYLLYEAVAHNVSAGYASKLLGEFEPRLTEEIPTIKLPAFVEPLSDRELEVLVLIAEGLSNQEVAQRLYISLRTVKWHTTNIYQKLGVKNRTQAVNKARGFGIL